jgi:general secretion pathway protein H
MRPCGRSHGFSLIELLVVVIVGIVMSIAVLSLSLAGGDRAIRDEAQRVISLVEIAQDESLLQGREFGLEIMQGAYRFLELDPLSGQWTEILGDDTLRLRELPEEVELDLYIEDRQVILKRDPARMDTGENRRPGVESFTPHVLIYSSGEMTPFELHFLRDVDDSLVAIRSDVTGAIEFVDVEETM